MKKILLASVALTAFAGAAAAEVSFGGDAEFGYNDDIEDGFYYSFGLTLSASQELDNGFTASASADITMDSYALEVDESGTDVDIEDIVVSLTNGDYTFSFGDVSLSADDNWTGVTNMEADGFAESADITDEAVAKVEATMGNLSASISAVASDDEDAFGFVSYSGSADLGAATVTIAGQTNVDDYDNDIFGLTVAGSAGGIDWVASYAKQSGYHYEYDGGYWVDHMDDMESFGIQGTYTMGDVAVTAFYVANSGGAYYGEEDGDIYESGDAVDDNYGLAVAYEANGLSVSAFVHDGHDEDRGIDVAYDMGNGLSLFAGDSLDDGSYVAAEYDLGGGAALLVSFGDDDGNDEIGPNEYNDGTTVELSLAF